MPRYNEILKFRNSRIIRANVPRNTFKSLFITSLPSSFCTPTVTNLRLDRDVRANVRDFSPSMKMGKLWPERISRAPPAFPAFKKDSRLSRAGVRGRWTLRSSRRFRVEGAAHEPSITEGQAFFSNMTFVLQLTGFSDISLAG